MFFNDDSGHMVSLPVGWTSIADDDPFLVMAAGRAYFRVEDLCRLVDLIRGLKDVKRA